MKRYGNLWGIICSEDNIELAHKHAQKGKKKKAILVLANEEYYLEQVRLQLINHEFHSSEYQFFTKNDSGKEREIANLPYFPDRIVHWALIQVLEPLFTKRFISQTYASLPDRGNTGCLEQLHEYLRDEEGTTYCLKLDIRKFFPSIDKAILKAQFRDFIKDEDALWLIDEIIDSYPKPGIPIGNYTSQYFGNFYLTAFDHFCKEVLGIKYYLRYMDDIVILYHDKEQLWIWYVKMRDYLYENLHLYFKGNYQVFPVESRGIDYVGYRSFHRFTLLRTRTKKKLKHITNGLIDKIESGEEFNEKDCGRI